MRAISRSLGVSQPTVSKWFRTNMRNHNGSNGSDSSAGEMSGRGTEFHVPDARVKIPREHHAIILARHEAGESQEQIAADYGVSQRRISGIIKKEQEKANKAA